EVQGFNEGLIALLSEINLGPAPPPGEVGTFARADIRRQIVLNRIDPVKVALLGAEQATVTRSGRTVDRQELQTLVVDYLSRSWEGEEARTEITYARMPEDVSLSSPDLELKVVDPLRRRLSGSFSLSIAALSEGRLVQRLPVSLKVRVFEKVAVLKSSLGNNELLSPEDVELTELETTSARSLPFKSIEELAGKRLKRRMKAGQILTGDDVESPPLIERGDEVTLVVHYKNITVGCPGKAWQNGRLGEKILVRNQYGKNLTGTVQDANTVLITQ
ncbi:MAG: flagellar basal body P-ring formation protein FlgA, partial [Candidatus Glassbacteria bacterium]|nr:flagellar basal body P-ring formation protein FlgA [Candidatus Glassbacteria bacterium]